MHFAKGPMPPMMERERDGPERSKKEVFKHPQPNDEIAWNGEGGVAWRAVRDSMRRYFYHFIGGRPVSPVTNCTSHPCGTFDFKHAWTRSSSGNKVSRSIAPHRPTMGGQDVVAKKGVRASLARRRWRTAINREHTSGE